MSSSRWLMGLSVLGVAAGYLALAVPREPFANRRWEVETVMVLDPNATVYRLERPYRVIREGEVTVTNDDEAISFPVVRLDLNIDGEHVVVFARQQK